MLQQELHNLGLSEKEAAVYLALLNVGSAPASVLGSRTGINRSTAQYTCQQLVKRGLVKSIPHNNTFIYSLESPRKLLLPLAQQKKELTDREDRANRLIGELEGLINPQARLPKVRFFEGLDGVIEMFNDVLKDGAKVIYGATFHDENADERFSKYLAEEYIPARVKLGIRTMGLFNDSHMSFREDDKELKRIALILPREEFPFEACLQIYGHKVAFYSYKKTDLSGVIIENNHIFGTTFSLLKAAWDYARTLPINQPFKDIPFK